VRPLGGLCQQALATALSPSLATALSPGSGNGLCHQALSPRLSPPALAAGPSHPAFSPGFRTGPSPRRRCSGLWHRASHWAHAPGDEHRTATKPLNSARSCQAGQDGSLPRARLPVGRYERRRTPSRAPDRYRCARGPLAGPRLAGAARSVRRASRARAGRRPSRRRGRRPAASRRPSPAPCRAGWSRRSRRWRRRRYAPAPPR